MEVKYALVTLLKILISTPTILLIHRIPGSECAALISTNPHSEAANSNVSLFNNTEDSYYDYEADESPALEGQQVNIFLSKKLLFLVNLLSTNSSALIHPVLNVSLLHVFLFPAGLQYLPSFS